jgi:acetyl-CoA carboxylase biotin carboxyl carrier protein
MKDASSSSSSDRESFKIPEKAIRKLSEILRSTDLAEIEVSEAGLSIRVRGRETQAVYTAAVSTPAPSPISAGPVAKPVDAANADLHVVRSPFIGTFYRSPSPNSAAFVEVGQVVTKGQALCIVEAMKIMNEIESDSSGVIEKIFIENGTPVDFNAPLFAIRKN